MKKTLGITLAVAFAISAVAAPAMGASENAKGEGAGLVVQQATCATYGQLWKIAKDVDPHMTPVGAKKILAAIGAGAHPLPDFCD